jgi:hypothetical protein
MADELEQAQLLERRRHQLTNGVAEDAAHQHQGR